MRERRVGLRATPERPITWAVIEWLQARGWPLVFPEVQIPRGLIRGRVDVAAASTGFRTSVAVEVKAAYRPGDAEGQLFDARRVAERVYIAAPPEVIQRMEVPTVVGILEARPGVPRPTLELARDAALEVPESTPRKEYLHALMRSAMRTGRFDSSWAEDNVCPACLSGRCPFWTRPLSGDEETESTASPEPL